MCACVCACILYRGRYWETFNQIPRFFFVFFPQHFYGFWNICMPWSSINVLHSHYRHCTFCPQTKCHRWTAPREPSILSKCKREKKGEKYSTTSAQNSTAWVLRNMWQKKCETHAGKHTHTHSLIAKNWNEADKWHYTAHCSLYINPVANCYYFPAISLKMMTTTRYLALIQLPSLSIDLGLWCCG